MERPLGNSREASFHLGKGSSEAKTKCPLSVLPHSSSVGPHSLATHVCLVPEPWDAEGLQQVTATQQQNAQF
jgi:hypothetical protein